MTITITPDGLTVFIGILAAAIMIALTITAIRNILRRK